MTRAKKLHQNWKRANDKNAVIRQVLVLSVSSENFGLDEWRYTYKDGSKLIYRKLTKELVL